MAIACTSALDAAVAAGQEALAARPYRPNPLRPDRSAEIPHSARTAIAKPPVRSVTGGRSLKWSVPPRGKFSVRQVGFDEPMRLYPTAGDGDDALNNPFKDDKPDDSGTDPDARRDNSREERDNSREERDNSREERDDARKDKHADAADDSDTSDEDDRQAKQRREDSDKEHLKGCRKSIRELRQAKLADISLDITQEGKAGEDYPWQCELSTSELLLPSFRTAQQDPTHVAWTASGLCHKPLYFEELALERYGHSICPLTQPVLSAAHFFGTLPILPYKMGLMAPNECVYTLGHYRPGNCAPHIIPAIPFTWRAGLYQAGATVGAVYLLP